MPRSGWLALGAVLAALATTQPWSGRAWLAPPATWVLLAGAWVAIVARWHRRRPPGSVIAPRRRPGNTGVWRSLGGKTAAFHALRVFVVMAGALPIGCRVAIFPVGTAAGPTELPDGPGPWIATVVAIGNPRDGNQVATIRLGPDAEQGADGGGSLVVALTAPADPQMAVGDTVQVSGRLRGVPDGDYGSWLAESGVDAVLASRTLDATGRSQSIGSLVDRARRAAADALATALPEPAAGLAAGILIGLRDRVDRGLARSFTAAGVSHVVAISGWNIAIVAALATAALRRWPRRRRSVAVLALIGLYTVFTGASPSVLRAALMASTVTVARETGRAGNAGAALGWAAVLMLLVDPRIVGDAGFQLSSLATAGLIAWATPLTKRLQAWRGHVLPGWLCESLGVSLAAEAATLPVVLVTFGRLALIAPLVNVIVVPLVPPSMALGVVAMAGGLAAQAGLPQEAANAVALPGWVVLTVLVGIVQVAASLPFASVALVPPLNVFGGVLVAVGVVAVAVEPARTGLARHVRWRPGGRSLAEGRTANWAFAAGTPRLPGHGRSAGARLGHAAVAIEAHGRRTAGPRGPSQGQRVTRLLAMTLVGAIAGLVLIAAHRADGTIRIDVLDVGQGDAILVQGDRGSRMLVDGGPDPGRLLLALDERLPPWDRRIDLLVLSHPHEDHVAGLPRLLERYRVRRVLEPGMQGPGPGYRAFAAWLQAHGLRAETVAAGDTITLDSIGFRVLWPDRGAVPRRPPDTGTAINNVSIVLLGAVGRHRFLLAGDIEEGVDPVLLARGVPRVEVLKVAHHGSRTSSTDAFLAAAHPAVAVISAGLDNRYGHPTPQTIQRLQAHGATVMRTDLDGTVEIALEADRWVTRTAHSRPAASTSRSPAAGVRAARPTDGPTAARSAAVATTSTATALGLFRCAVPGPSPDETPAQAQAVTADSQVDLTPTGLMYDRADVRAQPRGGDPPAPAHGLTSLAPAPLAGRGGDLRLARRANRGPRDASGSPTGGGSCPVARPGQAAAVGQSRGRAPPPPSSRRRRCGTVRHRMSTVTGPALGYYWGDDDYGLERAAERIVARMGAEPGERPERWRIKGDARSSGEAAERIARIAERVGTAPFFGGGTLAIVAEPGGLVRWKQERDAISGTVGLVAPGNGLVFVETLDGYGKRSVALEALSRTVADAGGDVREIRAPKEGHMVRRIEEQAAERGMRLGRGAAQELATRLGAFVREGDVDRRRQGWLAVSELEKLALYRPDAVVTVEDVRSLVPEAIPGSAWALLDAISLRRTAVAVELMERVATSTAAQVLLTMLHRRIRELLRVGDLMASRATPVEIIRVTKLKPYPAGERVKQAPNWTAEELESALEGLLELDVAIKGGDGQVVSEGQIRLGLSLWIADHVARRSTARR